MAFKWNSKEVDRKEIDINESDFNRVSTYDSSGCYTFCNSDTPTCINRENPDAIKFNTRLSPCWELIENIKYDSNRGLFTDGNKYYLYGECDCGELFISEVNFNINLEYDDYIIGKCRKCKPDGK